MTTIDIEFRVEEIIEKNQKITINQIVNELRDISLELKSEIRKIVSNIILKKGLKTECVGGKLFVINKSALDKSNEVRVINKVSGVEEVIGTKCTPNDGDWIVYLRDDDKNHIYVDKKFSRTDARLLFSKIKKVNYKKVNIKMYHKKNVLIVAPYQWD